jgi:type VI secretion system lysozyme-like protein
MRALESALSEPKKQIGSKALLFDRLIDNDPEESTENPAYRFNDRNEVIDSIAKSVSQILNTRATVKHDEYKSLNNSTVNFGLPTMFGLVDFNSFDGTNRTEWGRITNLCERAISIFETRLNTIKVEIVSFNKQKQSLSLIIHAKLTLEKFHSEVSFPVSLEIENTR